MGSAGDTISNVAQWVAPLNPIGAIEWAGDLWDSAVDHMTPEQPEPVEQEMPDMSAFYESQAMYLEQLAAMQEAQMQAMQDAAAASQVESEKDASDYAQTNAEDTQRKQLLRRGLMSTFTRYPQGGGGAGKTAKLGG